MDVLVALGYVAAFMAAVYVAGCVGATIGQWFSDLLERRRQRVH